MWLSVGPVTPGAIALVLALLAVVFAIGVVWAVAILAVTFAEALALSWMLARLLPASWKHRWFLRSLLISGLFGLALPAALVLNARAIDGSGVTPWLPVFIGVPFFALLAVLGVVEVARLFRWFSLWRRARAASAAGSSAAQGPVAESAARLGTSAAKLFAAKLLRFTGALVASSGVAFSSLLVYAMLSQRPDPILAGVAFLALSLAVLVATLPWYLARPGGRFVPKDAA